MKNRNKIWAIALLSVTFLNAEEITLKGNQIIKGPIIKENTEKVFIDLGYKVLEIPRSEITSIKKEEVAKIESETIQQKNSGLFYQRRWLLNHQLPCYPRANKNQHYFIYKKK